MDAKEAEMGHLKAQADAAKAKYAEQVTSLKALLVKAEQGLKEQLEAQAAQLSKEHALAVRFIQHNVEVMQPCCSYAVWHHMLILVPIHTNTYNLHPKTPIRVSICDISTI